MFHPMAALCLACVLHAQKPEPLRARGPVKSISLAVEALAPGEGALRLDPKVVSGDLTTFFWRQGIPVLPAQWAETSDGAYLLEVSAAALQYSEGTSLISVSERLASMADKQTMGAFPSRGLNFMAAQAGSEGLLLEAREVALEMATRMLGKVEGRQIPPTAQPLPVPDAADSAHRPPPERPKPLEVPFSRVKVRIQPPEPPYPDAALEDRVEGTVVVRITVDPDGRPIRAVASGGHLALKDTALRHALQWLFEPVQEGGSPQWATFDLPVSFRLPSE